MEYSELDMLDFALHYGREILKSMNAGAMVKPVGESIKDWKQKQNSDD